MSEIRIEKKFVYQNGDDHYKFFIINSMIKKIYSIRKVNSIYFDTFSFKNVWDNINGFENRTKIRLRWYNNLDNSDVFFEEKLKKNLTTIKKVKKIGNFKNYQDLDKFINQNLNSNILFNKYKLNLNKTIYVSYDREYFIDYSNKLRFTLDQNLSTSLKYYDKKLNIDKIIFEIKHSPDNTHLCNKFIIKNKLKNRNQKFSKYVFSFLELNELGLI